MGNIIKSNNRNGELPMKKIVDFDVRSFNLTPNGVEDGTTTRDAMRKFVLENYPFSDGWEIQSSHVTHDTVVRVALVLVKYETETKTK
jgi:hypothetical protein